MRNRRDSLLDNGSTTKNGNSKSCIVKLLDQKEGLGNSNIAVHVSNLYYTYESVSKQRFALNGVNLNILKGEIYALLGPSGCGKTTVLRCITKTLTPFRGKVVLPIWQTKETAIPGIGVGYMPQELCLFGDLTIGETLWLFGGISGIPEHTLKEIINDFKVKFELPPLCRLVGTLSGGQKRRVSLIAAFIHNPPFLILDEPTVGIDPIMRKNIWDYMISLASQGTTILVTTHYIDEAKDASTVGLMREGKLLAELSPVELLRQFNEKSLERCFYLMCVKNDDNFTESSFFRKPLMKKNMDENGGVNLEMKLKSLTDVFVSPKNTFLHRNVKSLMTKNMKQLSRNPVMLFFQFILPALTVAAFGLCIGARVFDMPIAIVNEEDPPHFSEWFLNTLNSYPIRQVYFDTLEEAKESVRLGYTAVAVQIPEDFTLCLRNKYVLGITADNTTIKCGTVHLHADTTNQIISLDIQDSLYKAFRKFEMKTYTEMDSSPLLSDLPLVFQDPPIYGSMDILFSEYVTPAILLLVIHYLAMVLTGFGLGLEKLSGVMERLEVCGVSKKQILKAQIIVNFGVVMVQAVLMMGMQFALFDTKVKGNIVHLIVMLLLQGLCGMLQGFFLSAIAQTVSSGMFIGVGSFFSNLILCGLIWPLQGMSIWMRWVARLIPVTISSEGLRSVLSRGWGLESQSVWLGYISIVIHAIIFLIGSIVFFKTKIKLR